MTTIKEYIWPLREDNHSTKTIFKNDTSLLSSIKTDPCLYGHAIYIDRKTPDVITATVFSTKRPIETGYFDHFVSYLKRFDKSSYKEILFALDSYRAYYVGGGNKIPPLAFRFNSHPIVDALLEASRGILLWHHQLENLYLFYKRDKNGAITFRKEILMKKWTAFDFAREIEIATGWTAADIIEDRMIFERTTMPSLKEAAKLFEYLRVPPAPLT